MTKPQILFLANVVHHTQAVHDHINAITACDSYDWHVVNPVTCKVIDKFDLSRFDAIGFHYSVKFYDVYHVRKQLQAKISAYQGTKFIFLQDEYQNVNLTQEHLYRYGFDLLFTLVSQDKLAQAYPDCRLQGLKKITVLTGYVSKWMKNLNAPPVDKRSIDVSYRGRLCPYWLGSLAYQKESIASGFSSNARTTNLKLDISVEEADRLYGDNWLNFLMDSKAVLGTESGASIWDFDGSVAKKVAKYLAKHKGASFLEVYHTVLEPLDGNILYNAISPRVFEAAATKTAMVLFPGFYSGVCYPGRHYIELKEDFSNFNEVLLQLQDTEYLTELTENAYQDLIASDNYSYRHLTDIVSLELSPFLQNAKSIFHADDLEGHVIAQKRRFSWLNVLLCFYTETRFAATNFLSIVFDRQYTARQRWTILYKNVKRYIAYFLPRLGLR